MQLGLMLKDLTQEIGLWKNLIKNYKKDLISSSNLIYNLFIKKRKKDIKVNPRTCFGKLR